MDIRNFKMLFVAAQDLAVLGIPEFLYIPPGLFYELTVTGEPQAFPNCARYLDAARVRPSTSNLLSLQATQNTAYPQDMFPLTHFYYPISSKNISDM